ncbi:MAG: Gfo/Idh/MocA family oxidoreductase [Chitinophagaceae bacterium]|nr:Gfo/Idh/MocA family oxidoreductase [Chitinophagaceae bacterium]
MSTSIRTALIGYGKAAFMHAQALKNIPEVDFIAVQGRDLAKAAAFAGNYQVKAYDQLNEMITKEKIEVVVICTPHPDHKNVAVEAMQAGAHVLVEKPLASSLADCDEMISTATRLNKKLGVVSQRRFFPSAMRMKKAIDEGKIGQPMLGSVVMLGWRDRNYYEGDAWRGTWDGEGGGVLVNQAPHQLDLLQWYMDDEIDELYGIWKNINHSYIEVDDTALAIVKFKKGGVGNILVSNSQKPGIYGKVHVHGSNGASVGVETDRGAMFIAGISSIVQPPTNDIWTIPGEEKNLGKWEEEDAAFFKTIDAVEYYIRLQDRDFILAVLNDTDPLIPGKEGRKTVEIFTAIYKSTREGSPVKWPVNAER